MKPTKTSNPFLRSIAASVSTVLIAFTASTSMAADLTWDADTVTAAVQAGSGSWNTTNNNWWNGTTNIVWAAANAAIFAGTDSTIGTFHEITLAENLTAQKITFTNSGYRLGAASALSLSLTNVGNAVIGIASGKTGTIGNNAAVRFTANSNTGTRIDMTTGGILNIETGGLISRTGQLTSGFSNSGGTLGFMGSGTVNVAGTLSFNVATPVANGGIVLAANAGNNNILNVDGGTVSSNSTINGLSLVAAGTSGTLNLTSGLVSTTGTSNVTSGLNLANGTGTTGTVNLDGGTISTFQVNSNYINGSNVLTTGGTSNFNFNGGTLKSIANNANFMNNLSATNVKAGGALIDSNGFNITIGQALLHDPGLGASPDGGLTKSGAGILTLSGANTYTGATTLNAGSIALTGTLASNVTANTGTTISGTGSTTGSLTFNSGSTLQASSLSGYITASGGVHFTGPTQLIFDGILSTGSTYDVADYGAGGVTNLSNLSTSFRGTINDDTANSKITFTAGTTSSRTWNTTSGVWEAGGTSTNWLEGDQKFYNGDSVIFGNPATASVVTVTGLLLPNDITINNTNDYTLGGTGTLAGTAPLTKDGTGTLNISNTNTYSGDTNINAGTLNVSGGLKDTYITISPGAAMNTSSTAAITGTASIYNSGTAVLANVNTYTGSTTVNTGASLQLGDGTTDGTIASTSLINDGTLTFNTVGTQTYAGAISGTGSLIKSGAGTMNLPGAASSFSGGTTINTGTLVSNANALSGGAVTINPGATLTFAGGTNASTVTGSGAITAIGGSVTFTGDFSGFSGSYTHNTTGGSSVFNTATSTSASASYHIATDKGGLTNNQGVIAAASGDYTLEMGSLSGVADSMIRGGFSNALTGTTTLRVGALNTDTTFAGVIINGATKVIALTKVGTGKLTLTGGNNTYTGDTTVLGGTLAVSGTSIPNAGKLVIDGGKVEPTGTEVVDTLYFGATQAAPGTYGAAGSGAIHIDDVHFTGIAGVVSVTNGPVAGYASWETINGATGGVIADHDHDGVPNGIEYFIGGPNGNTTGFTALPGVTSAGPTLSVTWTKAADYPGVYGTDFLVETSSTLGAGSWTTETLGVNIVISGNNITYTFPAGFKKFVRLRVIEN